MQNSYSIVCQNEVSQKDILVGRLRETLRVGETVRLSSGMKSNLYVDGKLITLDPEGCFLIASVLFEILRNTEFEAVGGLVVGADPIAASLVTFGYTKGRSIRAFMVRKERKKHGMEKLIEGHLNPGAKVIMVDDVITTGRSMLRAISAVEEARCHVVKVIALIDREEGGGKKLRELGYDFEPVVRIQDFGLDVEVKTFW